MLRCFYLWCGGRAESRFLSDWNKAVCGLDVLVWLVLRGFGLVSVKEVRYEKS